MMNLEGPPRLSPDRKRKLDRIEDFLKSGILGQDEAIDSIVPLLQAGEMGLRDPSRPLASFLFLGPTGVGKTQTTLTFSRYLHGNGKLIRLDMSEYKTLDQLGSLLGSPEREGVFEQRYRDTGGSGTLLFDEIEKAHPLFFDLLLQILDAARVTTSSGRTLDLHRYYIVLTTNLASHALLKAQTCSATTRRRFLETQASRAFRPETFARIEKVVLFEHLGYEIRKRIATRIFAEETERLQSLHHCVRIENTEVQQLIRTAANTDSDYGARPLRRKIVDALQSKVVQESLLSGFN